MECIEYDAKITSTAQRRSRLQCAFQELLMRDLAMNSSQGGGGDRSCRKNRELQCVALMVPITLSDILLRLDLEEKNVLKRMRTKSVQYDQPHWASSSSSSPKIQRVRLRQEAYQAASTRVEQLLRQAHQDAAFLAKWCVQTSYGGIITCSTSPAHPQHKSTGRNNNSTLHNSHNKMSTTTTTTTRVCEGGGISLSVVVMAALSPSSWKELALYQIWQSPLSAAPSAALRSRVVEKGGEGGRGHLCGLRCPSLSSPFRYASLILLSIQKISMFWAATPTSSSLFLKDLHDLLLPHQQLLLDISWCLEPPYLHLPYHTGERMKLEEDEGWEKKKKKGLKNSSKGQRGGGDEKSQAELVFQSFLTILSSRLDFSHKKNEKDKAGGGGRVGMFARYASFISKVRECGGCGGDDRDARRVGKYVYRNVHDPSSFPYSYDDDGHHHHHNEEENRINLRLEEWMIRLQWRCEEILSALYGCRRNGSYGKAGHRILPWIFSHGGSMSSSSFFVRGGCPPLAPPPHHFSFFIPALNRRGISSGGDEPPRPSTRTALLTILPCSVEVPVGHEGAPAGQDPGGASRDNVAGAALHTVRGLQGVHSCCCLLLGQLAGPIGSWDEAVRFCRHLQQRGERRHGMKWGRAGGRMGRRSGNIVEVARMGNSVHTSGMKGEEPPPQEEKEDTGFLFSWSPPIHSFSLGENNAILLESRKRKREEGEEEGKKKRRNTSLQGEKRQQPERPLPLSSPLPHPHGAELFFRFSPCHGREKKKFGSWCAVEKGNEKSPTTDSNSTSLSQGDEMKVSKNTRLAKKVVSLKEKKKKNPRDEDLFSTSRPCHHTNGGDADDESMQKMKIDHNRNAHPRTSRDDDDDDKNDISASPTSHLHHTVHTHEEETEEGLWTTDLTPSKQCTFSG